MLPALHGVTLQHCTPGRWDCSACWAGGMPEPFHEQVQGWQSAESQSTQGMLLVHVMPQETAPEAGWG